MKTLIITMEYPPQVGGIATHTFQEAVFLKPAETIVLAPKTKGDTEFDATNAWKTIRKDFLHSFFWPRWLKLFWATRAIVKQEKIERIIVHHALPVGYVARLILVMYKVPYFVFFHGSDVKLAAKKKRRLRFAVQKAAKLFVNSAFLQRRLEELLGKDLDAGIIHPCPGDDFFEPADEARVGMLRKELGLEGKRVMLTVARLADGKGYPHLARMLPKILEKIPNLVWVIVGTGPKEGWFMQFVQKNELVGTVRFLGAVPYSDLPTIYKLANIFVLLTHPDNDQNESWGSVFLEAAAAGVPVVAGRAGGVEEAVVNGTTGLIVDTYNEEGVIDAVVKVLTDKELHGSITKAARARVETEFRWSKQLEPIS